ncbi:MAG TPA: cytochrome c [Blastocatellia bacterium]|nr:cytochrome c [Blastocatellia bacterium]
MSLSVLGFFFCFAFTSQAHEPITTKVRFNKEVIRVLQRNCLGCHHSGGIAFSLATYDEARPWAKAIKEEVLEKRMPPWRAKKGYGEFRNAPSLAQRDIDLLVNWVEGGAPKGDDKDLPSGPLVSSDWQLGKPELILTPAAETKIAAGTDESRTFVLPTNLKTDRWLTALDLQPRNAAVAHCAKFYILKGGESDDAPMMPVKEVPRADLQNNIAFATWMPGQKTFALGDGVAQFISAGSRIAVTIHYHGSGEAATDLPMVGLYFAKSPPTKQLRYVSLTGPDTVIPTGDEWHRSTTAFTTTNDTEAVGIRPTVHPLMTSLQATAYFPDGSQQVLIWTRGYQFDWPPTYYFKQRVALPKGTRIEVVTYFDNSDNNQNNPSNPAKPVRWSELATEPWCVLLLADAVQ